MAKGLLFIVCCLWSLQTYSQQVNLENALDTTSYYRGYQIGVQYFRQGVRTIHNDVFLRTLRQELDSMADDSAMMAIQAKLVGAMETLPSDGLADDSLSAWMGAVQGRMLLEIGLLENNPEALLSGMAAAFQIEECADPMEMDAYIARFLQDSFVRRGESNRRQGAAFLAENIQRAEVRRLPAGVQYEVLREGTGAHPRMLDKVKVHYTGWHLNGEAFDSSREGEPGEFQLNQVIFGWTDALMQMGVGAHWKIYIPSERAYGTRGNVKIGPDEVLVFELELLEIMK